MVSVASTVPTAQRSLTDLEAELARQVDTLVARGYPAAAGLDEPAFRDLLAPLADQLPAVGPSTEDAAASGVEGRVPFVVVLHPGVVARDRQVPLLALPSRRGPRPGFTDMTPEDLERFAPIDGLDVPDAPAYLATDVDTGPELQGLTPDEALPLLRAAGRSPLTVDEGIALVTHHPDLLMRRSKFSNVGSRAGDRRVTALWVSTGRPRLGWCYAGAPHSWLGSGHLAARLG